MIKKRFNINGRNYIVESDSDEKILDYIEKRIKELNEKYEELSSTDERLLVMLCELIEREYYLTEKINEILKRLNDLEERSLEDRSV
ncbi:cell division protein ZapA [Thermosipho globiformans]|uniref:cell division protein ZapA n=1 Tax=Thermosipho globiformans TaxID=380685 RepID=UPI000F8F0A22|nr:cell division protein ZapA [Thermosipho globiformans]